MVLETLEINTHPDVIRLVRCSSIQRSLTACANSVLYEAEIKTNNGFLPPIKNRRSLDCNKMVSSNEYISFPKNNTRHPDLDKRRRCISPSSPLRFSTMYTSESMVKKERTPIIQGPPKQNADSDSDSESGHDCDHEGLKKPIQSFLKSQRLSKSETMLVEASKQESQQYEDDFENDLETNSPEVPTTPTLPQPLSNIPVTDEIESFYLKENSSITNNMHSRCLNVRIQSLCKTYSLEVPDNTTIKNLMRILWNNDLFEQTHCTMDTHIILLFNHRLHIFLESNPNELVKDFLQLTPERAAVDFYVYAVPKEHRDYMYNYDIEYDSLFKVSDAWDPVYFTDYKQLERCQSILLSSLYALALYFRSNNPKIAGIRHAMEAQFFLQLRTYLYPPAVLAFKHAIQGRMFWFEKALLMDALIQLLMGLCPETLHRAVIGPNAYFDFIPLLFCWLLEKCDPNEVEEDHFSLVTLVDTNREERPYFQDPVTTIDDHRRPFVLKELGTIENHVNIIRHVDLRSLNQYLTNPTKHSSLHVCTCTEYEIYDPDTIISPELGQCVRWIEYEIDKCYKIMSRKYPFLTIITRGALTADISNQLILLSEERTVSLLFSRNHKNGENANHKDGINHFFCMFNPLHQSQEPLMVSIDAFHDEKNVWPDPRLPVYFSTNVITKPTTISFEEINTIRPADQVTVILLDLSRSMFDHYVGNDAKVEKCTHIDICKAMLGILSDNMMPKGEVHAFGLIEFGQSVKVTCPITRDRNKFENALKSHSLMGEWTHMHDAISEAVNRIKLYISSPLRAKKKCRKLIICLSDGINNAGSTTIENLYKPIDEFKIVIDFVSFLRDDQIDNSIKKKTIEEFRQLCLRSGGYVYSSLYDRSNIEIAATFEQDAAVWLSKRARQSRGVVEKPERHINPNFQQQAVRQVLNNTHTENSARLVRILKEFSATQNYQSDNFIVFAVRNDISLWKVILKGPENTPYENRYWMMYVEFDTSYPSYPPSVRFHTPIYHANISGDGKICHQIFDQSWCETTKMANVFTSIHDLLEKPNFSDAVSIEKAHLHRDDPSEYEKEARAHAYKHAKSDIRILKLEYQLDDDMEQIEEDLGQP